MADGDIREVVHAYGEQPEPERKETEVPVQSPAEIECPPPGGER